MLRAIASAAFLSIAMKAAPRPLILGLSQDFILAAVASTSKRIASRLITKFLLADDCEGYYFGYIEQRYCKNEKKLYEYTRL